MTCESCATFTLASESYTIYLQKPLWGGEDNKISKDIQRFNLWSSAYRVHDEGINTQPLSLRGIESACDASGFSDISNSMRDILIMADDNEEITISGLGDCMDAVYIIKRFMYRTYTPLSFEWNMVLEKVRDS